MADSRPYSLVQDLIAGAVVFFVALPLCLGVAVGSRAAGLGDDLNTTILSGIIAGIVGGIVVGLLSGSHTSVSGPAAGLTAVVAVQVGKVGSFDAFLVAVVLAGVLQIGMGLLKAGSLAAFFPSSVIKGLLAAIGVILILKQLPHLVGHDDDPQDDMSFLQPDQQNTFSELLAAFGDFNQAALVIGLSSLALLVVWDKIKFLKTCVVPAPLVVVLWGVGLKELLNSLGAVWQMEPEHLVRLPVPARPQDVVNFVTFPKWAALTTPAVYIAAIVIAVVASLETLLNLEAVDKLDPYGRSSPSNRELLAQGGGNIVSGLLGGLPVTSVIVRSSVNINAGARTKLSAVVHGVLLLGCVAVIPQWLNHIPLSCLAAILILTGYKLANPKLVKQMWSQGWARFVPFIITVLAIVFTDLLVGILIGLGTSTGFIIISNLRRPSRIVREKHVGGEVLRIELANTVSFLNRASLSRILEAAEPGSNLLLDARNTDYIDPDILDMIRDFETVTAPARGVKLSLIGFKDRYSMQDKILFVDYTTRELQSKLTPAEVVKILEDGNERFRTGQRLNRDLGREVAGTAAGQHPLAVVLSCIDSRSPAEILFDLGVGDVFVIRIAGTVAKEKVLGSMEYACVVAKTRLVVVLGHTRCGAVTAAVELYYAKQNALTATGCEHLDALVGEIQKSIPPGGSMPAAADLPEYVDLVTQRHIRRTVTYIRQNSHTLDKLVQAGTVAIIGGMYDIASGKVELFEVPEGEPR